MQQLCFFFVFFFVVNMFLYANFALVECKDNISSYVASTK